MHECRMMIRVAMPLLLTIMTTNLYAYPKTDADFKLLPPYCKARFGKTNTTDIENWKRKIGRGWTDIHHYCSGLDKINKANRTFDEASRSLMLNKAIKEFTYVQQRASKSFILYPEICTQKGRAYMRLDQVGAAVMEFNNAIKANPKYPPAYIELSEYYLSTNNQEEAKKILQRGIKNNPNSKSLKRRFDEL